MLPMLSGVYGKPPRAREPDGEQHFMGRTRRRGRPASAFIGDDIVQLNRIEYGVLEGERQAVLWVSSYDRIPGRKVYERLIETMSLQSERGETMYDYEDTGRYPGWYSSCRSSSGSLYVR